MENAHAMRRSVPLADRQDRSEEEDRAPFRLMHSAAHTHTFAQTHKHCALLRQTHWKRTHTGFLYPDNRRGRCEQACRKLQAGFRERRTPNSVAQSFVRSFMGNAGRKYTQFQVGTESPIWRRA